MEAAVLKEKREKEAKAKKAAEAKKLADANAAVTKNKVLQTKLQATLKDFQAKLAKEKNAIKKDQL